MIRFLFRFIGLLSLALAFIFLVYDGTKSIADQRCMSPRSPRSGPRCMSRAWTQVRPTLEGLAPWLWDPVASSVLNAPTCLVLVIIGTILVLLGRKRRPLIGYARH